MGTMYKEIVVRRRTPVVVGLLLLLVIMIAVSNLVEHIQVFNYKIGFITNPIISIITSMLILFEIMKCKVSYRYSIIADQLIIHRLKQKEQNVVENIKLKDIVYMGKEKDYRENYDIANSKRYVCALKLNNYCCIYKDGDRYRKFFFQPSLNLVQKINTIITK